MKWLLVCMLALMSIPVAAKELAPPEQRGTPDLFQVECLYDGWKLWAYKDPLLYQRIGELGVTVVRTPIYWSAYQEDGADIFSAQYEEKLDNVVNTLGKEGVEEIFELTGAPWWSNGHKERDEFGQYLPPTDLMTADGKPNMDSSFAKYMRHIVTRYRDRVRYWEIWNEQTVRPFWHPAPDVDAYFAMLRIAHDIIKELDPKGYVIIGGLAGASGAKEYADSDYSSASDPFLQYCKRLYELGAENYYDICNVHAYNRTQLHNMLATVKHYSRSSPKPMWLTEFGADSTQLGEDGQLRYMVQLAMEAAANDIDMMCFFAIEWNDKIPGGAIKGRALLNKEGRTPKPSFYAYQTLVRELAGTKFTGKKGLAGGCVAYMFGGRGGDKAVIICTKDEAVVKLPFQGAMAQVVTLGSTTGTPVAVTRGEVEVTVSKTPVLVTGR